jgi:hypothetical protein
MDMKAEKEIPKIPKWGTWKCRHRVTNSVMEITAYRGYLRDKNGTNVSISTFEDFWEVLERLPSKQNAYDILWVNGNREERINVRAAYPVVMNKISALKKSTHKSGRLIPIRCDK